LISEYISYIITKTRWTIRNSVKCISRACCVRGSLGSSRVARMRWNNVQEKPILSHT